MSPSFNRTLLPVALAAVLAGGALTGCEKKTTTTDTPAGATTSTTTSVSPSPAVSAAMSSVGDAAADAAITAKVKTALLADPDVKGLQINVDTRNGAVTLTGSANNQANLDKAVTVAKGVSGVKSVDSQLTAGAATVTGAVTAAASAAAAAVAPAVNRAADAAGDAAITAKVKSALLADPDVKALRIDVDTKDGVVTLTGQQAQQSVIDRALTIAKGVDGVRSVQNRLTAKS